MHGRHLEEAPLERGSVRFWRTQKHRHVECSRKRLSGIVDRHVSGQVDLAVFDEFFFKVSAMNVKDEVRGGDEVVEHRPCDAIG